jgi:hypothetical protein
VVLPLPAPVVLPLPVPLLTPAPAAPLEFDWPLPPAAPDETPLEPDAVLPEFPGDPALPADPDVAPPDTLVTEGVVPELEHAPSNIIADAEQTRPARDLKNVMGPPEGIGSDAERYRAPAPGRYDDEEYHRRRLSAGALCMVARDGAHVGIKVMPPSRPPILAFARAPHGMAQARSSRRLRVPHAPR